MAAPWEKYQQADGPWSNYQSQAAPEEPARQQSAPRGYTLGEVPIEAGKNLPESAGRFVGGVVQAVTHPVETVGGLLDVGAGALLNVLPDQVVNFVEKINSDPEATKRAINAANAVGGMYKQRYGDYESIKRTLATDPVGAVADLSTLLTGGGAAATRVGLRGAGASLSAAGAKINPMRPIASVIEAPFKMVAAGTGAGFNALNPKASTYLTAVEGRGDEVLNALRSPSEIVPGSFPTAAQAASPAGATKFSALGESSRSVEPTPYFERAEQQKKAQLKQIRRVGKTEADLAQAEKDRKTTAEQLYGISDKAVVTADSGLTDLMSRPSMEKVIARAKDLAAERNKQFQTGNNTPAQAIQTGMLDAQGNPITRTIPAQFAQYPGSSLHLMKMAFDDLISNPERFGIGAAETAAIGKTRAEFLKWAEGKAPSYQVARETFAKQSKPINQMQVGQYLEGKLIPALGEDTAALRATGYAGALESAPLTIKRATGQSRFDKLSQILEPDQIAIVESIRDDLARAKLTEKQASAATGNAPSATKSGTESLGGIRAPNLLSRVTAVANNLMLRLQGKLDEKLAIELATEMLDPSLAASALEKAMKRKAMGQKLADPFKRTGKTASAVLRTPAVMNMLGQQPEDQNALSP